MDTGEIARITYELRQRIEEQIGGVVQVKSEITPRERVTRELAPGRVTAS